MTPNKTTIKKFFEGEKQYTIPLYQRAYSWREEQWKVFLEDLEEATSGDNAYFFGNVLLEEIRGSETSDIIDGQQRIATIIIFVSALCNVLDSKPKQEKLDAEVENEKKLQYIKEDYLINRSKAKLQVVEYDRDYFKDVVIYNDDGKHAPATPSQERIKRARDFFINALKKKKTDEILKIFETLQKAEILSIPFGNKKDSVLMFELQNNRGKELTNLERLKSYLAYQIYTHYKEDPEDKLKEVAGVFEEIYRLINDIKLNEDHILNEDSILNYFNIYYFSEVYGFWYRESGSGYKQVLQKIKDGKEKIAWIKEYVKELKNAFENFKTFKHSKSVYKDYLLYLDAWQTYPFILGAYKLFGDDDKKLEQVFKALEIIAFRHKLIRTKADLSSRLNSVLENFIKEKSIETLLKGLRNLCETKLYWSDDKAINVLDNIYDEDYKKKVTPYLLMRYENYLREKSPDTKGCHLTLSEIKNYEIEHIAPQNKDGAKGYCIYDEEFYEKYLHCIGNLLLMGKSHNGSIGNIPFEEKLASYKESTLMQHKEVKEFADDGVWSKDSINNRSEKIKKFVLDNWGFEKEV